jgi:hypothetical protein
MKQLPIILFFLLITPYLAPGQGPQSCTAPSRYLAGSNVQTAVVRVGVVEGRARAALNGTDEAHDIIAMNGICLAVYSVPEGRLIATAQVNDDYFRFGRLEPGRYRITSLLDSTSRFAPVDAPLRVVKWPRGKALARPKIYLHFRYLTSGVASYASTKCKKCPNISARHNKSQSRKPLSDEEILSDSVADYRDLNEIEEVRISSTATDLPRG